MIRGYSVTKLPEALRNSAANGVLDHRNRSLFGVLFGRSHRRAALLLTVWARHSCLAPVWRSITLARQECLAHTRSVFMTVCRRLRHAVGSKLISNELCASLSRVGDDRPRSGCRSARVPFSAASVAADGRARIRS